MNFCIQVSGLQTNIYMTSLLEVVEEEGEIYPCECHEQLLRIRIRDPPQPPSSSRTDKHQQRVSAKAPPGVNNTGSTDRRQHRQPGGGSGGGGYTATRMTNGTDSLGSEMEDDDDQLSSVGSECPSNNSEESEESSESDSGTPSTFKCLDCLRYLCDDCAELHSQNEIRASGDPHRVAPLSEVHACEDSTEPYLYCPSHAGQRLRFYCRDCESAICISCTDIEHRHHNTARLHHAVMEHRVALRQLLDRVLCKVPLLESAFEGVSETLSQLHLSRDEAEHSITMSFAGLQAALETRQNQLLDALDSACKTKSESLRDQSEELSEYLSEIRSSCEFVSRALSVGSDTEVLMVRKQLGDRLEALSTSAMTNSAATSSVSLPASVGLSLSVSPRGSGSGRGRPSDLQFPAGRRQQLNKGAPLSVPSVRSGVCQNEDTEYWSHFRMQRSSLEIVVSPVREESSQRPGMAMPRWQTGLSLPGDQSEELSEYLSEIRSSCEFVSRALSVGSDTEVLMVRKQLGDRLEALSTSAMTNSAATSSVSLPASVGLSLSVSPSPSPSPSPAGSLDVKGRPASVVDLFPRGNSHIAFHPSEVESVRTRILNIGAISECSAVPWRSSCHPYGKNRRSDPEWRCLAGRPCRVLVKLSDFRGEPATSGGALDVLKADLQPAHPMVGRPPTQIDPVRPGELEVSFSLPTEGDYFLGLTLFDHHINGSPIKPAHPMVGRPPTQIDPVRPGELEVSFSLPTEGDYFLGLTLFDHHINGSPIKVIAIRDDDSSSGDRPASKLARTSAANRLSVSSSVPGGLCGSHSANAGSSVRSRRTSRSSLGSAMSMSGNPRKLVAVVPDDLLGRIGRKGRAVGEFANPQGVCCLPEGTIAVSDSNNQCVQVFTEKGECVLRFGTRGRGVGQLQRPTGISTLPNGNFVIADYENRCLSVFDASGKFLSRVGVNKLLGPKGVMTDSEGRIIAVDNKGSCVVVFSGENGKILNRFGTRGLQASQLAGPHYVALTHRGQMVVSDFHNHCIKVFDKTGKYAFGFGSNGEGNGQFNAPTGVVVDNLDNIIVADWGNSRLQVFDYQGTFMGYINSHTDPLYGPQDLSITTAGVVVAVDSGNHCVKLLDNKYGI
ncbi:unnamed protein product [Notodromas monacha]|uniref:B box-type domain-containing protein n=1 Tax=Notodromas monacha TaxID=399045 RepID=A0A7R9BQF9_9CRUS|nr:unnamed protein product [Notodromas monacha]CAG0919786.1 unnamed protein product [Notodromas monacha]